MSAATPPSQAQRFGATPEEWAHWDLNLGVGRYLLPIVSNPHADKPDHLPPIGKFPSRYNHERKVAGFLAWSTHDSTGRDLTLWSKERDYGIGLRTGHGLLALDADIECERTVAVIRRVIFAHLGNVPVRIRGGSPRCVFLIGYSVGIGKRVARPADADAPKGSCVELLGLGQQCVVAGTHPSGHRYKWGELVAGAVVCRDDYFPSLPEPISEEQLGALLADIAEATGYVWGPSSNLPLTERGADIECDDPRLGYLAEAGLLYDLPPGPKKQRFLRCPFKGEHSDPDATNPTEFCYFPAGSGGVREGHYRCLHASCNARGDSAFDDAFGYVEDVAGDFDDLGPAPPPAPKPPVLNPNDPMAIARKLVGTRYEDIQANRTLIRTNASWFQYGGACYVERDEEEIRASAWHFLDGAQREQRVKETVDGKKVDRTMLVPFQPQPRHASATVDALRAVVERPAAATPGWLDGDGPDPRDIASVADGLLHIPTRALLPHDPRFFTVNALPFAWGDNPGEPHEWLRFLDDVFDSDAEAIETLQEIFGYLLTPDTSQQKIFLVVGQRRSGKGTIGRVMTGFIGAHNTTSPTLNSLTTDFGIEPLIGKLVAVIPDARPSARHVQVVVERLLSISGEDSISVGRKYKSVWEGRLPARFVMMSNEVPQLADASGALAGRFLILNTRKTFYGKEDTGLTEKLLAELPAIFRWALDGRDRLATRGHFIQPASGQALVDDMARANSPILAFVEECCERTPEAEVLQQALWGSFREWCRASGRAEGNVQTFAKNMAAAYPLIGHYRPMVKELGRQMVTYRGLRLLLPFFDAGLVGPDS